MKVLVINSSPNMDRGNTARILNPFIDGMKEAKAVIDTFYLSKLNISPCRGKYICWFRTPGKCFINDDMQLIYPKLREADIWVIATPIYADSLTGPCKNLLDRLISLLQPFFEIRNGHCRHPLQEGVKKGKFVLISSCGLWELDNFNPLISHLKAMCKNAGREFSGALLRPHAAEMERSKDQINDIFESAKQAGYRLIKDGCIPPMAVKTISRELIPLKDYIEIYNNNFKSILDKFK